MKAILRYARISPKKASLIAAMVRRMPALDALRVLERLPKKGARIVHGVISSALANADHNAGQDTSSLVIRELNVTKGASFRRFIPIARGRARPIDKWTSHISVQLGVNLPEGESVNSPTATEPVANDSSDSSSNEDDIVYSATKPQEDMMNAQKAGEGDGDAGTTQPEDHGGATFQGQRKGSRGS